MAKSIAIIGRGIAGLATAFRFALAGHKVAIVGPPALIGSATAVAQGLMVNKGLILARDPLYALKLRGHRALIDWLRLIEKHANVPIPRQMDGALEPFWDEAEYRFLQQRIYKLNFSGFAATSLLTREEFSKKAGYELARTGAIGAYHYHFDGWFDPQATLVALEIALKKLGAAFTDAACERIEFVGAQPRLVLQNAEPILCDDVIVAAGYFSQALMQRSGFDHGMLRAVLGLNLSFARRDAQKALNPLVHARHSMVTTSRLHILGSTSKPLAWSMPDQATLMHSQDQLMAVAKTFTRFSEDEMRSMQQQWGIRLNTNDRRPLVGFLPLGENRRVGFHTALYKNGLQIADLCARQLCEAYDSRRNCIDPSMSPERRFKNN